MFSHKHVIDKIWAADLYVIYKERESSLYSFSNESVFKEKIEVKVGLIYGRSLPRYQNTISSSFVFPSWINNEFENRIYKLELKASVCISDKDRMRMFYLAY